MVFLNYNELDEISNEIKKTELAHIIDYERLYSNNDEETLYRVGVYCGTTKQHESTTGQQNPSFANAYSGCAYYERW